jgi:hypothetical protein
MTFLICFASFYAGLKAGEASGCRRWPEWVNAAASAAAAIVVSLI